MLIFQGVCTPGGGFQDLVYMIHTATWMMITLRIIFPPFDPCKRQIWTRSNFPNFNSFSNGVNSTNSPHEDVVEYMIYMAHDRFGSNRSLLGVLEKMITKMLRLESVSWCWIHPWGITWNIIMEVWNIIFLSQWVICRFHVNLPGCRSKWSLVLERFPHVVYESCLRSTRMWGWGCLDLCDYF